MKVMVHLKYSTREDGTVDAGSRLNVIAAAALADFVAWKVPAYFHELAICSSTYDVPNQTCSWT